MKIKTKISILLIFFLGASFLLADSQKEDSLATDHKITAEEYCSFLNAEATTDPDHLYDEKMAADLAGAYIVRSGEPGSYFYQVKESQGKTPVTFISFLNASRYYQWKESSIFDDGFSRGMNNYDQELKSNQITFSACQEPASAFLESSSGEEVLEGSWEEFLGKGVGLISLFMGGEQRAEPGEEANEHVVDKDKELVERGASMTSMSAQRLIEPTFHHISYEKALEISNYFKNKIQELQNEREGSEKTDSIEANKQKTELLEQALNAFYGATSAQDSNSEAAKAYYKSAQAYEQSAETLARSNQSASDLHKKRAWYLNRAAYAYQKAAESRNAQNPKAVKPFYKWAQTYEAAAEAIGRGDRDVAKLHEEQISFFNEAAYVCQEAAKSRNAQDSKAEKSFYKVTQAYEAAAEAIGRGDREAAKLHKEQASFFRRAAYACQEAAKSKNVQDSKAAEAYYKKAEAYEAVAEAIGRGDREAAKLHEERVSFFRQAAGACQEAAESKNLQDPKAVELFYKRALVYVQAAEAIDRGDREVAKLYENQAPFFNKAAYAYQEAVKSRNVQDPKAVELFYKRAQAYEAAAEAIDRGDREAAKLYEKQAPFFNKAAYAYQKAAKNRNAQDPKATETYDKKAQAYEQAAEAIGQGDQDAAKLHEEQASFFERAANAYQEATERRKTENLKAAEVYGKAAQAYEAAAEAIGRGNRKEALHFSSVAACLENPTLFMQDLSKEQDKQDVLFHQCLTKAKEVFLETRSKEEEARWNNAAGLVHEGMDPWLIMASDCSLKASEAENAALAQLFSKGAVQYKEFNDSLVESAEALILGKKDFQELESELAKQRKIIWELRIQIINKEKIILHTGYHSKASLLKKGMSFEEYLKPSFEKASADQEDQSESEVESSSNLSLQTHFQDTLSNQQTEVRIHQQPLPSSTSHTDIVGLPLDDDLISRDRENISEQDKKIAEIKAAFVEAKEKWDEFSRAAAVFNQDQNENNLEVTITVARRASHYADNLYVIANEASYDAADSEYINILDPAAYALLHAINLAAHENVFRTTYDRKAYKNSSDKYQANAGPLELACLDADAAARIYNASTSLPTSVFAKEAAWTVNLANDAAKFAQAVHQFQETQKHEENLTKSSESSTFTEPTKDFIQTEIALWKEFSVQEKRSLISMLWKQSQELGDRVISLSNRIQDESFSKKISLLKQLIRKADEVRLAWARTLEVYKKGKGAPPYWIKSNWFKELETADNAQQEWAAKKLWYEAELQENMVYATRERIKSTSTTGSHDELIASLNDKVITSARHAMEAWDQVIKVCQEKRDGASEQFKDSWNTDLERAQERYAHWVITADGYGCKKETTASSVVTNREGFSKPSRYNIPSPLTMLSDKERRTFPGAFIVESKEFNGPDAGQKKRVRILKTNLKYSYVRIEEVIDPAQGVVTKKEMIADHLLIILPLEIRPEIFRNNLIQRSSLQKLNLVLEKIRPSSSNLYQLSFQPASITEEDSLQQILDTIKVQFPTTIVEPDFLSHGSSTSSSKVCFPNDLKYQSQWNLHGKRGIHASEAWKIRKSAAGIIVGILDTGVHYEHEDLKGNMWENSNKDEEHLYGCNFADKNQNDPMDHDGHGSHCAGNIAASGDNGVGITGISLNGNIIMACKYLNDYGKVGLIQTFDQCLAYACNHGAKIINCSFKGAGCSDIEKQAIENARQKDVILVAAAGNADEYPYHIEDWLLPEDVKNPIPFSSLFLPPEANNNDTKPIYPASYAKNDLNLAGFDNVIVVAASQEENDELADFSNYGKDTVDLAAPGKNILSTGVASLRNVKNSFLNFSLTDEFNANASYYIKSGTSMAAPQVAGALAMVWAEAPYLTYKEVIDQILRNADYVPALDNGMKKVNYGRRLNLAEALKSVHAINNNVEELKGYIEKRNQEAQEKKQAADCFLSEDFKKQTLRNLESDQSNLWKEAIKHIEIAEIAFNKLIEAYNKILLIASREEINQWKNKLEEAKAIQAALKQAANDYRVRLERIND